MVYKSYASSYRGIKTKWAAIFKVLGYKWTNASLFTPLLLRRKP